MDHSFATRLPRTITYWIEDEIFFVKNTNFFVKEEEGRALAELLIYALNEPSTKGLVLDNREAKGVWPKRIHELWDKDSNYREGLTKKRIATLTDDYLASRQINRLSNINGMYGTSRAFTEGYNDEVRAFLLG